MKKVLITGEESYIGLSVERWLKQWPDEYEITTLDMVSPTWREHDFAGYDTVFHVAGIAHADVAKADREEQRRYYRVNTGLAVETAKKARKQGVRQFILMSSMIIYGKTKHVTKDTRPIPANFYGDSKWRADREIRKLETSEFKVVILRPPMIYGKGSKGNYPMLAKIAGKSPIFPKVRNRRSMLYIENLCEFVRLMIKNEERGVFFPQNAEYVNTSEMVRTIAGVHEHRIWVTSVLAPAVWIGKRIPGKIGNMCKKAFGDSWYEMEMSKYREDYRVKKFAESIQNTETKKRRSKK